MKLKIINLILILLLCNKLKSQFNINNGLNKYWNYRYALIGDDIDPHHSPFEGGFVEVGNGQGFSIPMRNRYRTRTPTNGVDLNSWHWAMSDPCCIATPQNRSPRNSPPGPNFWGICEWHDVMKEMGQYLAMLSAEYKLLSQNENKTINGQTPNRERKIRTYREIVFALNALNRLDINAERFYNNSGNITPLNGSLIRDDVDFNFADDGIFGRAEFFDNTWRTNSNSAFFGGNSFRNIKSDFSFKNNFGIANGSCESLTESSQHNPTFLSIDQLTEVLYGLKHVSLLIPPSENINLGIPTELNAKCEADAIIMRLVNNTFPLYFLTYPSGNLVCNGPHAWSYSKGLYDLYSQSKFELLTNCPSNYPTVPPNDGIAELSGYIYAQTLGDIAWDVQETFYSEVVSDDCEPLDWATCSPCCAFKVVCKTAYNLIASPHTHDMFAFLNAVLPDDGSNLDDIEMYRFSKRLLDYHDYQSEYALGLSRSTLYGSGIHYPSGEIGDYLHNGKNNRFNSCLHDNYFSNGGSMGAFSELNGLDYLNCFAQYKLARYNQSVDKDVIDLANNSDAAFPNMYDRVITNTFPSSYTGQVISNASNQSNTLNGFNSSNSASGGVNLIDIQAAYSIDSRCTVLANGNVRFKAPHIEFNPGFNTVLGALVRVDNTRMDCASGNVSVGTNNGNPNYLVSSKSVGVKYDVNIEKQKSISLYPNPTSENTSIKLSNYNNLTVKIGIYDMIGKLKSREYIAEVANNEDEKDINLDTESLPVGIYIVKVSHGDTYTSVKLEKR